MSRTLSAIAGLLLLTFVAQTALAGPFGILGRRWERRKAELYGELSQALSAEMDAELAKQMKAARSELAAFAAKQIEQESAKLQTEIAQHVAKMRKEAAAIVAAEAKRLDQKVAHEIAQLQKAANDAVKTSADRLAKRVEASTAELRKRVDARLATLPEVVTNRVDQRFDEWVKRQAVQKTSETSTPTDEPKRPRDDSSSTPPANNDAGQPRVRTGGSSDSDKD